MNRPQASQATSARLAAWKKQAASLSEESARPGSAGAAASHSAGKIRSSSFAAQLAHSHSRAARAATGSGLLQPLQARLNYE